MHSNPSSNPSTHRVDLAFRGFHLLLLHLRAPFQTPLQPSALYGGTSSCPVIWRPVGALAFFPYVLYCLWECLHPTQIWFDSPAKTGRVFSSAQVHPTCSICPNSKLSVHLHAHVFADQVDMTRHAAHISIILLSGST